MRRVISTTLVVAAVGAGIVAGGAVPGSAPSTDTALLGEPWEPDPFPLGVCLHGPELGDRPVCVLVDPEDA